MNFVVIFYFLLNFEYSHSCFKIRIFTCVMKYVENMSSSFTFLGGGGRELVCLTPLEKYPNKTVRKSVRLLTKYLDQLGMLIKRKEIRI